MGQTKIYLVSILECANTKAIIFVATQTMIKKYELHRRSGQVAQRGWKRRRQAAAVAHQLHSGTAWGAGAAVRRDALPRRVHEGGAQPAARAQRGQSTGEIVVVYYSVPTLNRERCEPFLLGNSWRNQWDSTITTNI